MIVRWTKNAALLAPIVNQKRTSAPARKNLKLRTISTSADTVSWYAFWYSGSIYRVLCTWLFYDRIYEIYENLQRESQFIGRKLKWLLFPGISKLWHYEMSSVNIINDSIIIVIRKKLTLKCYVKILM